MEIYKKYEFRWEILDVLIGGRSIIDTRGGFTGFPMQTPEDADRFMRCYGYDLEDPIEKAEAIGNFHEAISFVRKYFLQPDNPDGLKLEIPRKILEISDLRELLLMAASSGPSDALIKNWACSLLKVVHTIGHIDKDVRSAYFTDIQKQIFDRFYRFIRRDEQGQLFIGEKADDPNSVLLANFETKPKKSRESVLLKLLHKPESVADEIFDRVGLRFITHTPLDALRVVKFLKEAMVVMPANIKPSRSRNSLIDVQFFRERVDEVLIRAKAGQLSGGDLQTEMNRIVRPPQSMTDNPHSSQHYRAIQFTCRQLIKLKNPLYDTLKELRQVGKSSVLHDDLARLIDRIDLKYLQRQIRFFYPFEVQVMDQQSHENNEKGRGAHSEYRKAQIQTAMKRVMWNLEPNS